MCSQMSFDVQYRHTRSVLTHETQNVPSGLSKELPGVHQEVGKNVEEVDSNSRLED